MLRTTLSSPSLGVPRLVLPASLHELERHGRLHPLQLRQRDLAKDVPEVSDADIANAPTTVGEYITGVSHEAYLQGPLN